MVDTSALLGGGLALFGAILGYAANYPIAEKTTAAQRDFVLTQQRGESTRLQAKYYFENEVAALTGAYFQSAALYEEVSDLLATVAAKKYLGADANRDDIDEIGDRVKHANSVLETYRETVGRVSLWVDVQHEETLRESVELYEDVIGGVFAEAYVWELSRENQEGEDSDRTRELQSKTLDKDQYRSLIERIDGARRAVQTALREHHERQLRELRDSSE